MPSPPNRSPGPTRDQAPTPPPEPARRTEDPRAEDRAYRTCPACGAELVDVACRLSCPTEGCGYFLSCSDFY